METPSAWCCACLSNAGTRKAQGNANLGKDANGPPHVIANNIMVPAAAFYLVKYAIEQVQLRSSCCSVRPDCHYYIA